MLYSMYYYTVLYVYAVLVSEEIMNESFAFLRKQGRPLFHRMFGAERSRQRRYSPSVHACYPRKADSPGFAYLLPF
jgi:hypothetical protein